LNPLIYTVKNRPVIASLVLTLIPVTLLFITKLLSSTEARLFDWPRLLVLFACTGFSVHLLCKWQWFDETGLNKFPWSWNRYWLLASIPFLAISALSLSMVDLRAAEWSAYRVASWGLSNFSTGMFEEVLMRGVVFSILVKAWGTDSKGVMLAAVTQALIFGLAHLSNLYFMSAVDVIAQVAFATCIGIGFAGLVYLSGSLWPAILVHSILNAAGSINDYLMPTMTEVENPGIAGYVVVVAVFFVLAALPGLLYLKLAAARQLPLTK